MSEITIEPNSELVGYDRIIKVTLDDGYSVEVPMEKGISSRGIIELLGSIYAAGVRYLEKTGE